jgi:hypothetical protein
MISNQLMQKEIAKTPTLILWTALILLFLGFVSGIGLLIVSWNNTTRVGPTAINSGIWLYVGWFSLRTARQIVLEVGRRNQLETEK